MNNIERQYRSEPLAAIHETMAELHDSGVIPKTTMDRFDAACLEPITVLTGEEIRAIRERENVSQSVFAMYLNVSKNLVSDWERNVKKPGGPALRLLSLIAKHGLSLLEPA